MDFTPHWEKYERKQLAKSIAEGSSLGLTSARIDKAKENLNLATSVEDSEGIAENARDDLLAISQHSGSMGSLIGNVGISLLPQPHGQISSTYRFWQHKVPLLVVSPVLNAFDSK